jgi:ubiquinone/menaquinone biosynthesis C-methylase UbiE
MIRKFIELNRNISSLLEKRLPHYKFRIFHEFNNVVIDSITKLGNGAAIIDVGGGRRSPFIQYISKDIAVIEVDISDEELKQNPDLASYKVCDVTKSLPFEENSVDLIMSRSSVEHLSNIDTFMAE